MPNPKGSENSFSQRESDPSMKVDKYEEAKARPKELANVEYWENDFIKRYGIEKFNKPITNRFLEAARKAEKPKSALMNLVHTIPDDGVDDDTISKLMIVISIAQNKISALIEGRSTTDTPDKATMTTRIRDINKPNNENNQKKVLFADTVKENIKTGDTKKISQKTVPRKPKSTKYRLVYSEGIQRFRVTWVKQLLLKSGIKAYQLGNVDWVTDTKLEVCINEKAAPQLVKHINTIKGVT
ncbi:hypothetical protein BB558_000425 [Smittium angustum]|uniref:Uncharacterized protein n=1 Tax=Smittium angustum TaxID=133377 RepID=A0A2U1JE89_SMIAN|nr:hypothetical protein BB558_000425 [Smittium angustum]